MNFKKIIIFYFILIGIKSEAQNCGAPTNLRFYHTDLGTWKWDLVPNATLYTLQFKETYTGWDLIIHEEQTTLDSFSTPIYNDTISYDWRVIAHCINGNDTSITQNFRIECEAPIGLIVSNISSNSAILKWDTLVGFAPIVNSYVVSYRALGSGSWILVGYTDNPYIPLNNLNPNTTYEWCVNQICPSVTSPPNIAQFTTLSNIPPCTAPAILNVLNLTNTSAKFNWQSVNNSSYFLIQYRAIGSSQWNLIQTQYNNTQYLLTGLNTNTAYEYQVATVCNHGTSAYSLPFSFTTNCIVLNNSFEWIDYVQIKDKLRISQRESSGYSSWNDPANLVVGQSYTIKVSAGFSGGNINQSFATYLDVNQNGTFDFNEKVAGVGLIQSGNIRTYNFTVPQNTLPGNSKMRIILLRTSPTTNVIPCPALNGFGEIEDYTVNITAPTQNLVDVSLESRSETGDKNVEVKMSPNPTRGDVYLESTTEIKQIEVFSITGQMLYAKNCSSVAQKFRISLPDVIEGIVLLKVTTIDGTQSNHKLLIRK